MDGISSQARETCFLHQWHGGAQHQDWKAFVGICHDMVKSPGKKFGFSEIWFEINVDEKCF